MWLLVLWKKCANTIFFFLFIFLVLKQILLKRNIPSFSQENISLDSHKRSYDTVDSPLLPIADMILFLLIYIL